MLAGARGQPSLRSTHQTYIAADVLNAFERLMRAGHWPLVMPMSLRGWGLGRVDQTAALLWEETMDRLSTPLRAKDSILYEDKMQTDIYRFQYRSLVFTDYGSGPVAWLLHRSELRVMDGPLEPLLEQLEANGATITLQSLCSPVAARSRPGGGRSQSAQG